LGQGSAPASGAAGSKASFRHLDPGGPARFSEKVPVNLVFVGYERDQVRRQRFLAGLPSRYRPVNRSRLFYGVTERLGISYSYDYDVPTPAPATSAGSSPPSPSWPSRRP
jgi:hypothetical protein